MHKLSVITITLNSAAYVEQTIQGVVAQDHPNLEYIIVDGGSTDGTVDIIRRYDAHITRWISEPDKGISDAMNKGLALASGDFVYFLNSDDFLAGPTVLSEAGQHLSEDVDIFLFSLFFEKDGVRELQKPGRFGAWTNFKLRLSHQSTICSMALFERIGDFDTSFAIAMDYDLFLRAYRRGVSWKAIDITIGTMRLVGVSSGTDWPSLARRFGEERRAHMKECRSMGMQLIYMLYWSVYLPYRKLRYRLSS